MSVLAHVFEAAGLATVVLTPMRFVAESMKVPRALYCEFPLGWPVGRPQDPEFQHRVLKAAFSLLERESGPVLDDFPDTIASTGNGPMSCPLPPRHDPDLHPAIDEAQALRAAYDRAVAKNGRTSVGRVVSADQIPEMLEKFIPISQGESWKEQGLPDLPKKVVHDIRAYYEELAFELADGPVQAWAAEHWFYDETEAGKLVIAARRAMQESGAPQAEWFYLSPGSRT